MILLIGAFLNASLGQVMPATAAMPTMAAMAMNDMPMAIPAAASEKGASTTPCKNLAPTCCMDLGCAWFLSVPARLAAMDIWLSTAAVAYWSNPAPRNGRSIKPDLFPPIRQA